MAKHLRKDTRVKVKNYSVEMNGLTGTVSARDGEYYIISLDIFKNKANEFIELFACELIELNRVIHSNNIRVSKKKLDRDEK